MQDAIESLESFTDLKLPVIKFGKEGFGLVDGDPAVESFQGVLLFTKESNVYYEKAYKAGQNLIPDCASSDGIKPNTPNPKHPTCKGCPMNQFGSSKVGDGKACKNTRPMFFLLGGSIMPRVLRVPPSSLVYVRNYVQRVAMDFGKYWGVITRVTIWKKEESQEYNNIKFTFAGTLPKTCQRDATGEIITQLGNKEVDALRAQWLQFMKVGNFGIDEPTNDTAASPYPDTPPEAADSGQPGAEPQF